MRNIALPYLAAIAIAASLVGASAALAKPAYIGGWGLGPNSCIAGEAELGITRTTWGEPDSVCRIRSVTGGKGVWHVNLFKCKGDGVPPRASVIIWATASRATTQYAGTKFRNNFVRCY